METAIVPQEFENFKNEINRLIGTVDLSIAIDYGIENADVYIDDNSFSSEFRGLQSQLLDLKKKIIRGTISPEKHTREANKIRTALSNVIDIMEDVVSGKISPKLLFRNVRSLDLITRELEQLKLENKILQKQIESKISVNTSILKERISKLAACWSDIYIYEREFIKVNVEFVNHILSRAFDFAKIEIDLHYLMEDPQSKESDYYVQEAYNCARKYLSKRKYKYFLNKFMKVYEDFDKPDCTLESNKFWLGRNLYESARNYHNCYPKFMNFFQKKEFKYCQDCLLIMKRYKLDIEKATKELDLIIKVNP